MPYLKDNSDVLNEWIWWEKQINSVEHWPNTIFLACLPRCWSLEDAPLFCKIMSISELAGFGGNSTQHTRAVQVKIQVLPANVAPSAWFSLLCLVWCWGKRMERKDVICPQPVSQRIPQGTFCRTRDPQASFSRTSLNVKQSQPHNVHLYLPLNLLHP